MNIKKINKGFTLIEVIISIAVIGLIISALFNINIAGWEFFNYNQDRVTLISEARLINTNLERQIRNSKSITISSDTSGNDKLELSSNKSFYVNYDSNGKGVLIYNNNGSTRNITTKIIDSHTFEPNNNLVEYSFILSKDDASYEIYNEFYPRGNN